MKEFIFYFYFLQLSLSQFLLSSIQLVSCLVIFFHTPSYLLKVYGIFVLWENI